MNLVMKPCRKLFVVMLFVVFAVCGSARADTVFYDDFQSDSAGLWDSTADLDPAIGTGDTGGAWYVSEGANGMNVQVLNNQTPLDNTTPAGLNNYVSVYRANSSEFTAGAIWGGGFDAAATVDKIVTMRYCFCKPTSGTNTVDASAIAYNDTTRSYSNMTFGALFSPTGDVKAYDYGTLVDTNIDYTIGQWNDVVVTANMAAGTYTITVGTSTTGVLHWTRTADATDRIASFAISVEGKTGYGCWDNIQLDAVFPATQSLLLPTTGLVGLLAYAWRKRKQDITTQPLL